MNCAYCKREVHKRTGARDGLLMTRDHYIPVCRGGTNSKENIRIACSRCNTIKGNMMPEEWERFMRDLPMWWTMTAGERKRRLRDGLDRAVGYPLSAEHKHEATRPLGKLEPAPLRFSDPAQQGAYEAYARKYWWVLRVPITEENVL